MSFLIDPFRLTTTAWGTMVVADGADVLVRFSSAHSNPYAYTYADATQWITGVDQFSAATYTVDPTDVIMARGVGSARYSSGTNNARITHSETTTPFNTRYANALTIEAVIRFNTADGTYAQICGMDVTGLASETGVGIYSRFNAGNPVARVYTSGSSSPFDAQSSVFVLDGNAYHFALRWGTTSNKVAIFMNGVKRGETATTGTMRDHGNGTTARMGLMHGFFNHSEADPAVSRLHGLAVFPSELSDATIATHYAALT